MITRFENGHGLIYGDDKTGAKILFIADGPSLDCIVLEHNEFPKGSDDWANKEMEDYLVIKKYSES